MNFSFGSKTANADLEPLGKGGGMKVQKSFKIRLHKSTDLWNNQRIINLNKEYLDLTRVRDKLSFDYLKMISNISSLRTQFIHLHIMDLSGEKPDTKFQDYGLYTQTEQTNNMMLKAHGLNPNANLYKAVQFSFSRSTDAIMNVIDKGYSQDKFQNILEIKGINDHTKLINMLDDINNPNLDINEVFDKHFNRENFLTWMAVNILFGNTEANTRNFYLYSPVSKETWYFMPEKFDSAWGYKYQPGLLKKVRPNEKGLWNYWNSELHRRFFRDRNNVKALSAKIDSLTKIINREQTMEFTSSYYGIVSKFVKALPDLKFYPGRLEDFEAEYKHLADITEENRSNYYTELEKPAPFRLGEPKPVINGYGFDWEQSFDVQGDDLTYNFQLASDPGFQALIADQKGLKDMKYETGNLGKGTYYWRITAHDSKGNEQIASDVFTDETGTDFYGIKKFTIQ